MLPPTVTTNAATAVTTTGGTVNGGVNPSGTATTAWFEWGTDPALATFSSTTNQVLGIRDDEPVGERGAVGVYFRDAVLLPGGGLQRRGDRQGVDRQFQHRRRSAPTVMTNAATSLTATGGTVNGGVNPNGAVTAGWFEWGTDPTLATFSSTTSQSLGSGTTSQAIERGAVGVTSGTPYYFRVAASNSSGTVKGSILNFSTTAVVPTVTTNAATAITATGGTVNGGVNPNGSATTAWFEWGTSPTLASFSGTTSQSLGSGTSSQSVNAALSG